jgi:two-component system response regulator FixJ
MNGDNFVVHVVDDDGAVRKSLQRLLRAADVNVRLHETPEAFLGAAKELEPGCVLLDLQMPQITGLELLERLQKERLAFPVIVMTGMKDVQGAVRAMKGGALEYLEKPFTENALFAAIATAKDKFLAERVVGLLVDPTIDEARARVATLSRRERQVLHALARGDGQKLIGYNLGISVRTVEVHRARMLRRLGEKHLAKAIRVCAIAELGGGDIDPPEPSS